MATHSTILAWRIPWREEPGGLLSIGSQRVGQDWACNTLTLSLSRECSQSTQSDASLLTEKWGLFPPLEHRWACDHKGRDTIQLLRVGCKRDAVSTLSPGIWALRTPATQRGSEVKSKSLSRVCLFATPWTVVHRILHSRTLEWVAFPFSRGSSQPRDQTQVFCIAGGFFTSWATMRK